MPNNKVGIPEAHLVEKMHVIRGQHVMIDRDLAELYEVETKQLKRQVRRNIERFPTDFMFELTEREVDDLRCQIGTSSLPSDISAWGGNRYLPMTFTEHGILMLSSVLGSPKAIHVNIEIMRVFTRIRKLFLENKDLRLTVEKLGHKTKKNAKNIDFVLQYLEQLIHQEEQKVPRKKIGYKINTKS